ncbi:hypothetical protein TNCV_1087321 [Trichonephila clavipes]|nr:hypothetical protein TNCV_1087321 [Trichonephila clavipes]
MLVHILRDSPNNVFKDMTSYHGLTRSFANRECLGRAGKATAAVPRYRRINCADAKTMAWIFHRGSLKLNRCHAEFRLVEVALLLTDF